MTLPPPRLKTHICAFPAYSRNGQPTEPGTDDRFWCWVCDTKWTWNGATWLDERGVSWHNRNPYLPRGEEVPFTFVCGFCGKTHVIYSGVSCTCGAEFPHQYTWIPCRA